MAQRIELTKTSINAIPLPPRGQRATVYDTKVQRLAVRVTDAGKRTYYVVQRTATRVVWVRVGTFPDITVEQARKLASSIVGAFADGKDPTATKREERAQITLGEAFEQYMARHIAAKRKRTGDDLRQMWERCLGTLPDVPKKKHARPRSKHPGGVDWQRRKLNSIDRADVTALHHALGKTTPIVANRVVELLSAIYNWARKDGGAAVANPAAEIAGFDEQERDRFLQAGELPKFFTALAEDTSEDFRHFVLLSLLTGARRGNVLAMRWAALDKDECVWHIPADEAKAGVALSLPLVPDAMAILQERKVRAAEDAIYVFPAASASGHMTPPKKRWAQLLKRAELKELRLHDLRRSLGSWQSKTGASLTIVGKSLGHRSPSTTAIYARLDMDPVRQSVERATDAMLVAAGVKTQEDK